MTLKTFYLPCLVLFISTLSFSQRGNYLTPNFNSTNVADTIFNKKEIIVRNSKKDTLEISGYFAGRLQGKKTLYNSNGDIRLVANYKKGLLHGKVEHYPYRAKQVSRIEYYKAVPKENKSELHGKTVIYYPNGDLQETLIYKNGAKNGKYIIYHSKGQIKEKGTFKNNLNIGNKLTFNKNGNLLRNENFILIDNPNYTSRIDQKEKKVENLKVPAKISVLNGSSLYYHYNGFIASELEFKSGKKNGVCREYHQAKNKSLKSEIEFKKGLEHGSFIHFDKDGKIERQGIYYKEIEVGDTVYKGVYDGEIISYNKGKLQRIENWENFMRNGVQENYTYHTGKLSLRTHFKDNLKCGLEEGFDSDGLKRHESYYEIVEIDGNKVSQQIGINTTWTKGIKRSETNWENGKKNGLAYIYYENGSLERMMNYKDGELDGLDKTYYENGQIKEDYMYQRHYNSRHFIGWNRSFDESGQITKVFYSLGNDKNSIELRFENGKMTELMIQNGISISLSEDQKIKNIINQKQGRSIFGYYTFTNEKLRKVAFKTDLHYSATANFTSNGKLIQVYTNTGKTIEESNLNTIAQQIANQYNPKWNEEDLIKGSFKDGKHQWKYKDGTRFFNIEFKDSLPHGTWVSYNPIDGDTLVHAEFEKGLPIGNWVEKTVDGVIKSRIAYHPNHKIKENWNFASKGLLREVRKYDSLGKKNYSADYHENGNLKSRYELTKGNSLSMWPNGDTSNFNFLDVIKDSIKIERRFYKGNILKLQRKNNLTTGEGEVKTYHENGQLNTLQELKDNKSHGLYSRFDDTGKLIYTGAFKDGKRNGKWIKYNDNGDAEISHFDNGEFIIDKTKEDPNSCTCYDKSLPSSRIGFAPLLSHFEDYETVKDFFPKTLIPIDSLNYEHLFYVGLNTDNNRSAGFTGMKILMFSDFSFYYPAVDYLKFNLNPCLTPGYIGNMRSTFNYTFSGNKTLDAYLGTKTISVGLVQNPLVDVNNKPFTILFETDGMRLNENDIRNINFIKPDSNCYPLGIINDLMKINISDAKLNIRPYRGMKTDLPILPNELQQFYGFEINEAQIDFYYESKTEIIPIKAKTKQLMAGSNFVAGKIEIAGKSKKPNEFSLQLNGSTIKLNEFKRFLEKKGFYRVKMEIKDSVLLVEFYTEK